MQARLLDALGQAVIAADPGGYVTYWNRAAETMFGWSSEEATGRGLGELLYPEGLRDRAEEAISECSAGRSCSGELLLVRKDGTTLPVMSTSTPVHDERGGVVGVVSISTDITQQRGAEERLERSEQRSAALLANAPALVYRRRNEPEWPMEFASDYARELTGHAPDHLMSGTGSYGDLILEEDRQGVWEDVQAALDEHRRFKVQYAIRCRDGVIRHVEEYGRGVYGDDGRVEAIEGLICDVTDRKRMEEQLREAERRLRTLVERIPVITYLEKPGEVSHTIYVSPQYERMLGYSIEEALNDPEHWVKAVHPDDREKVLEADRRANETGEPFTMEYRYLARDGRTVWIRDESALVRDEEGRALYWLGIQADITAQKETEEALRASEQLFRNSFDDASIGMAIEEIDGRFIQANHALCEILGYSEEELLEKTFQEITHPDDLENDLARVRRLLAGEIRTYQIEKRYVHKQGHAVWVLLNGSLVRNPDGSPRYFIVQVQDVTERREAQKQLNGAEKRFRTLVEQRWQG